ncbi:MAG: hypothetical protein V2A66_07800 [Pseudomonadota bacterium]
MKQIPLAVVAALDEELRIIRSKMDIDSRVHLRPALFEEGTYLKKPLLLVRSGIGLKAMGHAIGRCLESYRPDFCLHVGYCGGADPYYQAGDLLIADEVVDAASKARYKPDSASVERALGICKERALRGGIGTLVTVAEAIASPHEKAFVGTEHGAHGIDMESSILASACEEKGVGYLVVRAVLDPMDVALPDMCDVINEEGEADSLALAEHMIKKPRDILSLPRLQYFASAARGAIAAFVEEWIERGAS